MNTHFMHEKLSHVFLPDVTSVTVKLMLKRHVFVYFVEFGS